MSRSSLPTPVFCRTRSPPPVVPVSTFAERQQRISIGEQLPFELHLILHEGQCVGKRKLAPQQPRTKHLQLETPTVGNACFPANGVWLRGEHSHNRPVNADHHCPCLPIPGFAAQSARRETKRSEEH